MNKLFLPILPIIFLLTACTPRVQAPNPSDGELVLRLLVLDDYSGSLRFGEAAALPDALSSLVEVLASGRGGMIAYGIIEVDASPLKRLAIEPTGTDVQDARFSNNPFLKLQALHQQEISQDDTEGQDEISPPTSNDPRSPTEEFLTYLVTERRRLGTAKRTNLAAALDRATIYFNEPTSPPDTRDVLLLLTDGKDTTGRSYQVQLPDTVTILLVHDRPDDLGLLQPLRERLTLFENTAAAIQYVQRMLDRKEEPR